MQQNSTIESVFAKAHQRDYTKGQILLYQGQKTEENYYISDGFVKVYDVTSEGEEKLLLILGPGDFFPLLWTFKAPDSLHYFYETLTDSSISVVARKEVINAVKENHELAIHLLEYFVERSNNLMTRIECIEASSAKHKVAQVLSYLADTHGDLVAECAFKVRIPTTHQMIANMSGLNRSTASIYMKELEDEKVFKDTANGGFIIHTDRIEEFLNGS